MELLLWLIHQAYQCCQFMDVPPDHQTLPPSSWSDCYVFSFLKCGGPHCFTADMAGLPGLLHGRSLDPVYFPTNVSGIWEASEPHSAKLVHRGPYQLLMRLCLGSQTGSFLQPQSLSPLWSQKKVISLREDFLGALGLSFTPSRQGTFLLMVVLFTDRVAALDKAGAAVGGGGGEQWRGQMVSPISHLQVSSGTL